MLIEDNQTSVPQSRWKSPIFWTGIAAQIIAALIFAGVINVEQSKLIEMIVAIAFEIWTGVAMANNPKDAAKW